MFIPEPKSDGLPPLPTPWESVIELGVKGGGVVRKMRDTPINTAQVEIFPVFTEGQMRRYAMAAVNEARAGLNPAPPAAPSPVLRTRQVWVAWTNTDLTEGRGNQQPLVVCESQTTAIRLGAKKYIMGTDCPVDLQTAILIKGKWLVPGVVELPSPADVQQDAKRAEKDAARQRVKDAGVSDADLKTLGAL